MPSRIAPEGRGWRKLILVATATASLSVGAGIASGQGGGIGSSPQSNAANLEDVQCLKSCAGLRKAGEGSMVKLTGRRLGAVEEVTFKRAQGSGRIRIEPKHVEGKKVRAKVPADAASGRVGVIAGSNRATTPNQLRIVPPRELSDGGKFRLTEARAAPGRAYFFSAPSRRPRISYVFRGDGATDVRIQVVRLDRNRVVKTWVHRNRQPLSSHTARWNGRTNKGKIAANGRYRFRVGAVGNGQAETTADSRFAYYQHTFPVKPKKVGWGDGLGAGRGHQGQDLFAKCGTKLVAAQGGKVLYNKFHSAAGYYVIVRGQATGRDYVYMHLKRRSPLKVGKKVRTGQVVGKMGATGNASGCHLHFELWSEPGWYQGGSPMRSVTKQLRRWARWS